MSITGNLKTMELGELLQWVSHGRKTGTLVIDSGIVEKRIFCEAGQIISSSSTDPKEYLGHFLVSHGLIDELTLAKAMALQKEKKILIGKILTSIGAVDSADLEQMLKLKAEESIYDLFTWQEGEFRFLDQELPATPMIPISLDVTDVVLRGLERLDLWGVIRKRIPSMLAVVVGVRPPGGDGDGGPADKILELVNDERTVEEIALQAHTSEFRACRVLLDELDKGNVKLVQPRILGARAGDDRNAATEEISAEHLLDISKRYLDERRYDRALRNLRAARSLDPDNASVRKRVGRAEERILSALKEAGVTGESVPHLNTEINDMASLDITAQAGFMLTRIDGRYDVQTIVKISPLPPLEAMVVLWRLLEQGHIRLAAA